MLPARTPVNLLRWFVAPAFLANLALAAGPQLNEAPTPPARTAAVLEAPAAEAAAAAPSGFVVAPSNREESRIFFRTVYAASDNVASGWNGAVATGNAGTTSTAFKEAVLRRVNWFRAMAGVPAGITFDATYNTKAQKAALMMSANDALSHAPPTNWLYYSADGAEAAGKSNIFLGYFGPAAITGYIEDFGTPNTSAGHRRWILYPQTRTMGTGDIPPDGDYQSANALWVVTPDYGTARPAVRDEFVAWPPPGFVPYSMVFPRWSFSYPGADFSTATVTMQRGGAIVPVVVQNRGAGAGEASLVWVWDGLDANSVAAPGTPPASDTPVQVAVNGVLINGQTRNFSYTVTLFDPRIPGTDTVLATASGAAQAVVGVSNGFSCNTIPGANGYQWRTASLTALTAIEGAEGGTGNVVVDAPAGYAVVSTAFHAGGTKSFHLTTPGYEPQSVTLTRNVLASATSELKFKSRFQYASEGQVARAQVSTDDGVSWDTLFIEAGTNAPAAAFSDHSLPLAAYANRTLKVRFLFSYEGDGDSYNGTESNVGWYFDDVSFTNAQELTGAALSSVSAGATYGFTPPAAGAFAVQARGRFHGEYLFEWGPVIAVNAAVNGPPKITTHPASRTASVGGDVQFSVAASGPGTLSYQWFHGTTPIPEATGPTLDLSGLEPDDAGAYHVEVTNASGTTPSNSATLTVLLPKPVATTLAGSALSEASVKLNGHVEVSAQIVECGFEYGPTSSLGKTLSAGSASGPRDFEGTLSSLAANTTIFYRAFAEISGGARFRGAVKTIAVLKPIASLNVSVDPGGGTVAGVPGTVRVGDRVTLTAQPADGFAFTGWTGGRTSASATLAFAMPASLTLVAHFSSSPIVNSSGRYRGLALTTPATHASCGLITATIAAKGAFTGQAVIGGAKFALRGVFDAEGVAHFGTTTEATLPRTGRPPLLLRLHLPPGSANPTRILGDIREAAGFFATIDAPRAVFTAAKNPKIPLRNPPPNWPGTCTADLTVDATTPISGLEGRGWTSAKFGKDGGARFIGTLADGTRWSSTQPLAADGTVPIFALLHGGTGSFFGVVQLSGSPVTLTSTANWFRPAQLPGGRFPAGWPAGVQLSLDGGAWTPFKPNLTWPLPSLATTAGAAHLWVTGPGVTPFDWAALFALKTGAATVTPNASGATATFVINNSAGVFTGTFKTSAKAIPTYFSGVLVPGANRARGFFLTPTGSGPVTLLPQ